MKKLMAVYLVVNVLFWGGLFYLVGKMVFYVAKHGMGDVAERIWHGESPRPVGESSDGEK